MMMMTMGKRRMKWGLAAHTSEATLNTDGEGVHDYKTLLVACSSLFASPQPPPGLLWRLLMGCEKNGRWRHRKKIGWSCVIAAGMPCC